MWPEKRWEEGQRISEDRDSRVWNECLDLCQAARDENKKEMLEALLYNLDSITRYNDGSLCSGTDLDRIMEFYKNELIKLEEKKNV